MKGSVVALSACTWVLTCASGGVAADAALASRAQAVLRANCHRCHGQDGVSKGGFGYILERDQLLARGKVVPGKPSDSPLYQRVLKGEMPPKSQKTRPGPADVALLKQWIEAGAPAVSSAPSARTFLSDAAVLRLILTDLQAVNPRHRRFIRYLTLTPLLNAGRPDEEIQGYRYALAKLLNSLSWHPRVSLPRAIDPAQTVFRIDLRAYQWNSRLWDRVLSFYPYRVPDGTSAARAVAAAAGSELPVVRADWFVATASRPPLYYDLLQLPTNDRELERQLRVDVLADIEEETALRAGFNDSGVSRNNRMLERHDAAQGAYWRSYDFSDNLERQNIFEHPLGPVPGQNAFVAAGGEIIFNLPNGLQGYMLVDGNGRRVERAAIEIVSDPGRPDRFVEAGVSCMSCHVRGIIPKADQVRAHVEKNPNAFSQADLETVQALYPPEATLRALMDADSERYLKALARTGVPAGSPDPVSAMTLRYEATLDLPLAAAEVGLTAAEFTSRLRSRDLLARTLGPLRARGGTVQRQVFLAAFPDLVREFRLGEETEPSLGSQALAPLAPSLRPFTGHTGFVLGVAFSPDGRRALSGGTDKTVRLWDVASGNELRCLEGHSDEVLAVAFSPDGRRAVSGGQDRVVRLWDLTSGRELRSLQGHTDKVSSVAFSPDGRQVLSGSWDQTLRLWDVADGREVRRLAGHGGWVTSVAFSPDGRQALSGSYDRTARLWDLAVGRQLRRLEGHSKEVYTVAFSADGRRALSGGNDGTVRLWDVVGGNELRRFEGHANAVIRVAFGPDGRQVHSASSRYQGADKALRLWDVATGKELRAYGGGTEDTVWCAAFAADGRSALSGSSDGTLRFWNLARLN